MSSRLRSRSWVSAAGRPVAPRRGHRAFGQLPGQAEPLPVFAARALNGHAHALDDGTPVSTLVLQVGLPPGLDA
ncbi:TIGR02679 domain-containing protein [Streptomyces cyaneofuscatus]|uniref:TIGR02679 domain-containing protein n=1 Tax=Streptomyces TaxID=1883 RepID=UPI002E0FFB29|nr:TIGR02679 domain-containing protein [Streptomyces cyaneofuscatus]WTF40266.1 TIGR02679 domain-containing protein [Streptomyces cyaneofuscatus]